MFVQPGWSPLRTVHPEIQALALEQGDLERGQRLLEGMKSEVVSSR